MKKELALSKESAVSIFIENKMDDVLHKIEKEALSFVPDLSTVSSRKEIAALARKISKSKVILADAGKELTVDWKSKAKLVDASRKEARDFLSLLRDAVRKPLTDWEYKQEQDKLKVIRNNELIKAIDDAILFNELFDREKEIERKQFAIIKEQEEYAKKIAAERAEIDRINREKEIEVKAIEAGKKQAEEAAKREIESARIAEIQAKQKQEELRLRAIRIAEQAEADRIEAEKEAKQKRIDDIDIAKQKERQRFKLEKYNKEQEEKRVKDEVDKKANDKEHRRCVNKESLDSLVSNNIDPVLAKKIVKLIVSGVVKNISIKY